MDEAGGQDADHQPGLWLEGGKQRVRGRHRNIRGSQQIST